MHLQAPSPEPEFSCLGWVPPESCLLIISTHGSEAGGLQPTWRNLVASERFLQPPGASSVRDLLLR